MRTLPGDFNSIPILFILLQVSGIKTICVDIGDWDATQAALQGIGPIHLLVNNAGISERQAFFDITKDVFDK